jgi:hypothetical protein
MRDMGAVFGEETMTDRQRALRLLRLFCRVCPYTPDFNYNCEMWDCPLGRLLLPKGG